MNIFGVRLPQGFVSISVNNDTVQITENVYGANEAARMQGELFRVIDELQDLIDAKRVLPNAEGQFSAERR